MPSVSAIVLTRDSQRTIEACIQAIKPAVDHVIVVDTGSTDDTVAIAKANGAYVYRFEWCDDFAAARNFGDSLATTDWVIHVDSDEILREEDTDKIRKLCSQYKKTNPPIIAIGVQQINILPNKAEIIVVARMYKRGVLTWSGIIHEQLFCKRSETINGVESSIGFIHDGYNPNVINISEKYMRNIRLLQEGLEQSPENASYHFFLGREYWIIDDYEAAIPHLRHAIVLFEQMNSETLERAHEILILCLEAVDDYHGAEEIASRMTSTFPDRYANGWYKTPLTQ